MSSVHFVALQDARHQNGQTLFRGHSPTGRVFGDWSMGFQNISGPGDMPASFVKVSDRIDLSRFDHMTAIEFLAACRRQKQMPGTTASTLSI